MKAESHTSDHAPQGGGYASAAGNSSRSKATTATTTGKRKPSMSETPDGAETEEQKQKRARGRPRLDTKDETAADRRRTQIRLAQRAYRHRKDNAITSLEDRVQFLEKNNVDMSREFHRFYDLVMSEGLLDVSSEVARQFRAITDNFLRMSGLSAGETGYISPEDDRATITHGLQGPTEASSSSSAGAHSPRKSLPDGSTRGSGSVSASKNLSRSQEIVAGAMTSYEIVAQATPDNASFPLYTAMEIAPNLAPFASIGSPYATLPLSRSLAHHELTFGRRLERRTTERGLYLATVENPPPERYAAVFGFCLLFDTRATIADQLNMQLSNLVMPLQDQVNPQRGPWDEKMEQRVRLTFGFEKEFMNSDEIEQYLRQCGIVISRQAEFVDAEMDVNELSDVPPDLLLQGGDVSYQSQSSTYDSQNTPVGLPVPLEIADSSGNSLMPLQALGGASNSGMLPYMFSAGMDNMWGSTWAKPKLTISVSVLVEELASHCVCMGKHPGVRLRDVNRAIKVAAGIF